MFQVSNVYVYTGKGCLRLPDLSKSGFILGRRLTLIEKRIC